MLVYNIRKIILYMNDILYFFVGVIGCSKNESIININNWWEVLQMNIDSYVEVEENDKIFIMSQLSRVSEVFDEIICY